MARPEISHDIERGFCIIPLPNFGTLFSLRLTVHLQKSIFDEFYIKRSAFSCSTTLLKMSQWLFETRK